MHEQSETEPRGKRWYNVFGQKTDTPGKPLTPVYRTERESYPTVEKAVEQAIVRSNAEGRTNNYTGMSDTLRSEYPSNLPKGASLSPKGDLGALRSRETLAAFKNPIRGTKSPRPSNSYF